MLVLCACTDGRIVLPESGEPQLYVVLSPPRAAPADTALFALLITTGTPIEASYRGAERFEVRRVRDGALLDWRARERTGAVPSGAEGTPEAANFVLPAAGAGSRLGRSDVQPGETYALDVLTLGVALSGLVTVPVPPRPTNGVVGGEEVVWWPPSAGAAGYSVAEGSYCAALTRDTLYKVQTDRVLCDVDGGTRPVVVRSLDPNLYAWLTGERRVRSGLSAGYGVLGAYAEAPPVQVGQP